MGAIKNSSTIKLKEQSSLVNNYPLVLLTAQQYYKELINEFEFATSRIKLCTMNITFGSLMDSLHARLINALKRGVSVELVIDKYSLFRFKEGEALNFKHKSITIKRLNELKINGAKVRIIGSIGLNPFAHRMHTKLTIIDNTLYGFGGINFEEDAFSSNDIMFKLTDKKFLVPALSVLEAIKRGDMGNSEIEISSNYSILVDGGKPKDSIIYKRACDLAKSSRDIFLSSRMCPSGVLGNIIKANEGVCYFNRPSLASFPTNISIVLDQLKTGIDNKYKGDRFLHSKFILFKNSDGTKSFLCGSNNFNWRGVKYGTKEIAIYSKDVNVWNSLYDYMIKL